MSDRAQELSTYDLFVFWHVLAMSIPLAVGNTAHSGPTFLPWRRMHLIRLEEICQQVLGDPSFGLPYWDWAPRRRVARPRSVAHGSMELGLSRRGTRVGRVWTACPNPGPPRPGSANRRSCLGRSAADHPCRRTAFSGVHLTPGAGFDGGLDQTVYDQSPWSQNAIGHRNLLEGWIQGPQLHSRVHVWIGGDM